MEHEITLIAGLGNPGSGYSGNRHNVGFMAVDSIVSRYPFDTPRKKFKGEISAGVFDGRPLLCLKPHTYMNLSGESVREAATFYKIPTNNVIAIHDELDIPFGEIRVKQGGGHAGHNGLKSLDSHIGKDYHRIRIGIGHPGDRNLVSDYVLSDFSKTEKKELEHILEKISSEIIPNIIKRLDQSHVP